MAQTVTSGKGTEENLTTPAEVTCSETVRLSDSVDAGYIHRFSRAIFGDCDPGMATVCPRMGLTLIKHYFLCNPESLLGIKESSESQVFAHLGSLKTVIGDVSAYVMPLLLPMPMPKVVPSRRHRSNMSLAITTGWFR